MTQPDIRHHPYGSGHPYRVDPDQRHPVHPVGGEPLELRITTTKADAVDVEVVEGTSSTLISMQQVSADELYSTRETAEGHLTAASGATPNVDGKRIFRAVVPSAPMGRFRYRFSSSDGASTAWFETSGASWCSSGATMRTESATAIQQPDHVEWLISADGPIRCRFTLPLLAGDHVVGFGERFNALDQRGQVLDARVFEQYKQQGKRTYLPSPFAIVAGEIGWGFHVRTSRATTFDVGSNDQTQIKVEVDMSPDEPVVDLQIYNGTPRQVLAAHLVEINGVERPPDWVFAPWMSANEWNTQQRVLHEVETSIELDIPVGVIVIEAWSDEATFTAFRDATYNISPDGQPMRLEDFEFPCRGAWPDPAAMVAQLHDLGVKVLLWQIPLIPTEREGVSKLATAQMDADVATMIDRNYCVQEADGNPYRNRGWWFPGAVLPDWTNPDARQWWINKRRYLVDDVGIDGFKTDGGEHAWGDELRYANGTRGDVSNNLFANDYARAYHDLIKTSSVSGVTFSRAGFTGAGTVPCHWAGDEDSTWEAFRASITAGLTASASGIPFWGWDLAGFSGPTPTVELYLRATAMATLCPIMQYHSEFNNAQTPSNDRTPWNIAKQHNDQRAIDIYRQYAQLRQRLLPYLSAQADKTAATGVGMMRPLCFDHPEHDIWDYPYQYRFGDGLLVAPVCWENADSLDVYLPQGDWTDVWNGDQLSGGQVLTHDAPLHLIPAFATGDHTAELIEAFAQFDL